MYKRIISFCLALVLLLCLLPSAAPTAAAAGDVAINETNFPDEIFRRCVKQYDNDGDGVLTSAEIANVTEICCDHYNIYDEDIIFSLKGIEFFSGLKVLSCSGNGLTELDVSKNNSLESLQCVNNRLTVLDVSKNASLYSLTCSGNQLTALDVSKNTELTTLVCDCNQLTALDVSKNTSLGYLDCHYNQLTSLDVSKNTKLQDLECYGNDLTELDVSKNTMLQLLHCSYNHISRLDVSKCTALYSLHCDNNRLTELNIGANTELLGLYCHNNQMTTLDVSESPTLMHVTCFNNRLTALDVSRNTDLDYLDCSGNQLTTLDVSRNTVYLDCSGNQLTTLDVSRNTDLGYLDCSDNQLTTLDVSRNTDLGYLDCSDNKLTVLDVSANPRLVNALVNGKRTVNSEGIISYNTYNDEGYVSDHIALDPGLKTVPASNPFLDVNPDDFFCDAVIWAYYHDPQVTSGSSRTKFSPAKTCTREQVVTFLWRAKGCEEPSSTNNPFKDVPADAYYTKAVLWAVEQGITTGKSKTKFGVGSPCTREQVVTFLWRAEGEPEPESTVNPFTDVSEESYAYKAILWAVENGITNGTSKTKFSPTKTCTRGQVVTFLYRDVVGAE